MDLFDSKRKQTVGFCPVGMPHRGRREARDLCRRAVGRVDSNELFEPLTTPAERMVLGVAVFAEVRQRRREDEQPGTGGCSWPPGAMRSERQLARERDRRRRREWERKTRQQARFSEEK